MRNINMPRLGLNMEEGKIIKWYVKEGDIFYKGNILCEIESEKVTNEYMAEYDGKILKIIVKEGESAKVGTSIAIAEDIKI